MCNILKMSEIREIYNRQSSSIGQKMVEISVIALNIGKTRPGATLTHTHSQAYIRSSVVLHIQYKTLYIANVESKYKTTIAIKLSVLVFYNTIRGEIVFSGVCYCAVALLR